MIRRAVALPLLGAAGAAAWPFVEPLLPVLRTAEVPVLEPGRPPLRVLHVSDLHLLPTHLRRAGWVRQLARLEPDLIVSTGDHWSAVEALDLLVGTLGSLTSAGVPGVFVAGNNDYFSPTRPSLLGYVQERRTQVRRRQDLPWAELSGRLERVGWTDLTHRRVSVELPGGPVILTGTDDAHLRRDRYALVAGPTDGLALGVTHTPARRLLRSFAADGHALVIAGHTHGGQLRLPGVGPLVTNCDLPRWRARGLTYDRGSWLHVSAGLGHSPYVPVRLFCRPEATLLTLVAG